MIVTSGELLCTVVNDILDYSKLQTGNVVVEIRRTNLQETLDSVVKSFEPKALSKKLGFKTMYSPLVPEFVDTDNNRLQQILYNLLGNAVKFSDEGGSVEFAVDLVYPATCPAAPQKMNPNDIEEGASPSQEVVPLSPNCPFHRTRKHATNCDHVVYSTPLSLDSPDPTACFSGGKDDRPPTDVHSTVSCSSCRGILRFTVKDYGHGIHSKDFGRIFEPFSQATVDTERLYGGTGLGLAITAKLVERLGGRINVESELGEWSKFTVELPAIVRSTTDMSRLLHRLKDVRIVYVDEPGSSCNQRVVNNLELPVERFGSCQDMYEWFVEEERSHSGIFHICLVQEDLYCRDVYRKFAEATPSALVTFGPKRTIAESRAHFRAISDLIPCVLLQSLVAICDDKMCVRRTPSRLNRFRKVSVLIVEDNLINQKVLFKMLERLGVERIDIANNGQEAVDMEAEKNYDVIFMDMQMPVMCGDEACRIICKRYNGKDGRPKIAFVSAHANNTFETEVLDAGADGFMSKPFNIKQFEEFIQTLNPL
jgi:CheY-like chemotaxis protein